MKDGFAKITWHNDTAYSERWPVGEDIHLYGNLHAVR